MLLVCVGFLLLNLASQVITEPITTTTPTSISTTEDNEVYFGEIRLVRNASAKAVSYPCTCAGGQCSCCSGNVLENFSINMRQRVCMNMTYDADDFTIGMKLALNDNVFYNTKISGKNPPPACVPIPRISSIKFCVRLTNVYFVNRNVHACVVLETQWNKETAFTMNFDCIRVGQDGVSVVKPEEGGGLPHPVTPDTDVIEEYDELLENQENIVTKPTKPPKATKPPKIKTTTPKATTPAAITPL